MKYDKTLEFQHDLKKLCKKFSSLPGDLETAKINAIELRHVLNIDNFSVFEITKVSNTEELQFWKLKKFACKSLKGRGVKSGIRVIYAFFPIQQKVIFIEIYFKAKQENENRERITLFRGKINNKKE